MECREVKKILYCTDFSLNARTAFDYAIEAAKRRPGCELILLHVIPAPDAQYWKPYIYNVNEDVDGMAKKVFDKRVAEEYASCVPECVKFTPVFRIGKASMEINQFAVEENVDMIVMGRQGRGALESLLFGTVAEKVVRRAKCPVLVIPLPGKEGEKNV